jgi:hypothetical protein
MTTNFSLLKLNDKKILSLFSLAIFFLVIYFYHISIYQKVAGVDLLQRIVETKYFLMGVNPFDVMTGNTPVNPAFGTPAAYAYASYIFAIPLSLISDKTAIVFIFAAFDIFCLYAGLFLYRRVNGLNYSIIDPIILSVVLISIVRLDHIVYLNYGIISTFGLILTIYGTGHKNLIFVITGLVLASLKPSLLLPLALALCFSKDIKLLFIIVIINLVALIVVSVSVQTPALILLEQLQQTQYYFSDRGFYRWEGLFLFARDVIGKRTTIVGLCATIMLLFYYRKKIANDPIALIILVLTGSLCFFYNQEHAWTMAYPILATGFFMLPKHKSVIFPLILLILFMVLPSTYIYFESLGFSHYMPLHNLVRFGLLLAASLWLVEVRLGAQELTRATKSAAHSKRPI